MSAPAALASALADRYRLERELGAGGMATVYLAHDLKHDRDVALKVLRPELAASLGPERFLAEIRLTAKLQHPNIVPLFDSGEAGGFLYYVMPYVEGESLRARLEREQRLDVEAMLAIARPVAQALAYAHEQGVVHRDIKPENILLSRGQPLVSDFGIARAVSVAGGERLTATGLAVGTPAYMSPEQALGEETVDARSDVYSLGCVIYEMLAGSPPFSGATVQALIAKRLTGPPPHLTTVSSSVDDVVRKSLATAPQDRFATAVALADALVEAAKRPATPELSIVVLPFENLSPDPDQEFFADGLTEEVISDLSAVRALRVISRSSAMTFKGSGKRVTEIAGELNVRYVLEGSVRRAGNSLRIMAQLVDARTDAHLWAGKYPGTLDDVFDIQEKVAAAIVEALKLKLTPDEARQLALRPIQNVQAYEAWLRARQDIYRWNEPALERARHHLEDALAIIGANASVYAGLGNVWAAYFHAGLRMDPATLQQAEAYAVKALQVDQESAQAHSVLAAIAMARGRMKEGFGHAQRALSANPNDPDALFWAIATSCPLGRTSVTKPLAKRLLEIDPLWPNAHIAAGIIWWLAGRFDRALESYRTAARLDAENVLATYWLLLGLAANGRFDEADLVLEKPNLMMGMACAFFVRALRGDRSGALSCVSEDWTPLAWEDYWLPLVMAEGYAVVGETEHSWRWLARAVEQGWVNHPWLSEIDPWLCNLRGDSRFQQLMDRVRREWEEFDG